MLIEIRKAGFENKGAYLMLLSIMDILKKKAPTAQICMAPSFDAPYEERAKLGLLQKAYLWRYNFQFGCLAGIFPKKLRSHYGIVLDREVNIVLDSAGFAYSSHWGDEPTVELAAACRKWKRVNTKIILLPQAFGPFNTEKIKNAMIAIAESADIIFARDRISYSHLIALTGTRSNIKVAPDFTNLLEGIVPESFDSKKCRFCIVPNYRMIDKTPDEISSSYLPFLIYIAKLLLARGELPFFLIHEGKNDFALAQLINSEIGKDLPIVEESHPLKIKGILGTCKGTLGSRYHGLVNALSQGIPSLAIGWSHKYQTLLEDYGFLDGLITNLRDFASLEKKLELLIDSEQNSRIAREILFRAGCQRKMTNDMWDSVVSYFKSC